jgi:asparagine synthase (glutamine-hydrolysing)
MSGFAGIIRLEPSLKSAEEDRATIARMAEAIACRGPDAQQLWSQNGASFAFSLLTTGPAPQAASQPVTLNGNTWLIGDLRCDGRDDLIAKLEQHGASVSRSAISEELVLRFFSQFGSEVLPELNGDLSFALWEAAERRLIAFRDLSGARPFFYSCHNGKLSFSNMLQAMLADPDISRHHYDLQFIGDFLLGSPHNDPDRSIYSDIRRLPAGHLLEFSVKGLSVRRLARLPIEDLLSFQRDQELLEEFRRLFTQSVRDRLPESETSILLSGGLDSTSIAAAAVVERRKQSAEPPINLSAYTLDFYPLFQDEEGAMAERFADSVGLPFELLHIAHVLPCEGAGDAPLKLPEPSPWPYPALQTFYVSRFRQDTRVMLTGDAGDEILRGQGAPFLSYLTSHSGLASAALVFLRYVISRRQLPALGAGIRSNFFRLIGRSASPVVFPPWFNPEFQERFGLRARFTQFAAKPTSSHPYNPWSYAKLNGYLTSLMEGQDATFSGFPVECRAPFLDRRLLRFLLALPPIPWHMEKDVLRRAQQGVLPEEIRLRPKVPLQDDPLQLHMAAAKWSPQMPGSCPAVLRGLVEWPKLAQSLSTSPGTEMYVHLRPVLLALWLKAVENSSGIQ